MAPIRVIQVGVGGMGRTWLRTVSDSPEVEFAAWVDVSRAALAEQAQAFGFDLSHCYTSLGDALQAEQADGLINVTPPQFHEYVSRAAFDAGLPVLSEKPLAHTMDSARRTVQAAEDAGVVFMVAQNYRYRPFVQTMRELIASGQYGAPGQVEIGFYKGPHFGGFREEMDHPLIIDMSIHHFDMMRHILGADPVQVTGQSWNPTWSWFKGDASAALTFEFTDEIHIVYHGSWCSTGDETTWSGDWHIECEKGVIVSDDDVIYAATTGEPLAPVPLSPMERTAQAYLLHEFYRAVTEGITPATHGRDNLKSLGMVFAAVEAVESSRIVDF